MNRRVTSSSSEVGSVNSECEDVNAGSDILPVTEVGTALVPEKKTRKTIFLHIGWEKTGSSAIQAFCGRNQNWLHERGFDYPIIGAMPQHVTLYHELASKQPRRVDRITEEVRGIVASSPHPAMIFSHESLHLCNPQMFREMFAGHEVRVIAYLRRPDIAVISHFVTMVRFGYLPAGDLGKAIRMYRRQFLTCYDYFWQLELFTAVFGRKNVNVRHYHRDHLDGGQSVTDFMHQIGIDDVTDSSWPEALANPSLDIDQFIFVLRAARLLRDLPLARIRMITKLICDAMLKHTTGKRGRPVELFISAKLKRRINDFFKPNLEMLCQRYFNEQVVFDPFIQEALEYEEISPERFDEFRGSLDEAGKIPQPILNQLNAHNTSPKNGGTGQARPSQSDELREHEVIREISRVAP